MRFSDQIHAEKILILGVGREGVAIARHMQNEAVELEAYTDSESEQVLKWKNTYGESAPVNVGLVELGDISRFDMILKSPGFSPHHPIIVQAKNLEVEVTSATNLWMRTYADKTIGITGTKGKSTTSSLIFSLLKSHGVDVALGGNIGFPVWEFGEHAAYVVELSSYQCESLDVSPAVAVVTSLFPDHLDWHGNLESYYNDKLNLVRHNPKSVVLNLHDENVNDFYVNKEFGLSQEMSAGKSWNIVSDETGDWIYHQDKAVFFTSELPLLGKHNAVNVCIALNAVEAFGIELDHTLVIETLRNFNPLPHRLEKIADPLGGNLTFVDDSLSTNPEAAIAAIESFPPEKTVLIVGGQDRGISYDKLGRFLKSNPIVGVVGIPDSGQTILKSLRTSGVPTFVADNLIDAVKISRNIAPEDGFIVMSPAAPSYGIYKDFEEKSEHFLRAIHNESEN